MSSLTGTEAVLPASVVLRLDGQQITVRAVPFRHLEAFAQAAQAALGSLQALQSFTAEQVLATLGAKAPELATLCALCVQPPLTVEQVLDLPVDAAAELVQAMAETNADFFLRRLPAMLLRLAAPAAEASVTGNASSAPSPATATPTKPSSTAR